MLLHLFTAEPLMTGSGASSVTGGKEVAAAMLARKELRPFHLNRWDLAHRATDYGRWATSRQFYLVNYEHVSAASAWGS